MGIFNSFGKKKPEGESEETKPQIRPMREEATPGRWRIGDRIRGQFDGQYEVRQILGGPGKSGMGIVYVCYDHQFKEPVVLKTFQDKYFEDPASVDRFRAEAEAWVRLEKHYNLVRAKGVEEINGRPYVLLEYVPGSEQYGTDLSGWIWEGGLTIPLTLNLSIQICHGMMHAKKKFREMGKPFVHRDIKPNNILVTQDKVAKITDFGLVKTFAESSGDIPSGVVGDKNHQRLSLSKSGAICGTPPYMSPEQCRGQKDIDERSDIYAFGCVLYEMLTRRYVFEAQTPGEFIYHHLNTTPKSPNVHKELDRVVMKCLEKDKSKRYQSFEELEEVLARIYRQLTGQLVRVPEAEPLGAWELHNRALALYNLGFRKEAIDCYEQVLKIDPESEDTHAALGAAYYYEGRLDEAEREAKEALRINPDNATAHNNLALVLKARGDLDAAIREFREAVRIRPDWALAHSNLAACYKDQGRLDEAVSECRNALRIDPNYDSAHLNLGNIYYAKGNSDEAISEFKEALRINPGYVLAHHNLGAVYLRHGKLDEAMAEFRQALNIDPNDAFTHNDLGVAYHRQCKLDEAVKEYRQALRVNPNYATGHYNLGAAYQAQGKIEEAMSEYREALRIDPGYPDAGAALENLGDRDHGRIDKASTEHRKEGAMKARAAARYPALGISYVAQGRLPEAVSEECEQDPEWRQKGDPKAHFDLGSAHYDQGSLDEAISEYEEALRICPDWADAHNNVGLAYACQRKFVEAIGHYVEALSIAPNEAGVYVNLGNAHQGQRKLDEAIVAYENALRLTPNFAAAHYGLAKTYGSQGKFKQAMTCYQAFIQLAPPEYGLWVREAEEILRQLKRES